VHLGAYADTLLDARAGVVAPAVCYVVIDGTSWNGDHKPADYYMGWYGDQYGAEQHMRSNSIARALQHIPGGESPENRAHDMVWLDWATIQFRFYQPNSGYTGSFCVFGPVLSSPAHGAPYLAMAPI
jgi:hypothetical protein